MDFPFIHQKQKLSQFAMKSRKKTDTSKLQFHTSVIREFTIIQIMQNYFIFEKNDNNNERTDAHYEYF